MKMKMKETLLVNEYRTGEYSGIVMHKRDNVQC